MVELEAPAVPRNTILQGHVLDVLRTLPDGCVQTCISSPPYWSLRDYKTEPQAWGGDRHCTHEWGPWQAWHDEREPHLLGKSRTTERFYGDGSRRYDGNHQTHLAGTFCRCCGAWQGELGQEPTPDLFVEHVVEVYREVRRVLRDDGTAWVNIGDSYGSGTSAPRNPTSTQGEKVPASWAHRSQPERIAYKAKDLCLIPFRLALALQADGWWIRSDICWAKPNPMPESCTDRPTSSWEHLFLLSKSADYYFDADAIREPHAAPRKSGPNALRGQQEIRPRGNGQSITEQSYHPMGRNKRNVWTVATEPFPLAHFATFPRRLVEPMVLAGSSPMACESCGAPWRRVVDVAYCNPGNRTTNGPRSLDRRKETAGFPVRLEKQTSTRGWNPTCHCEHNTGAARSIVLDPFLGSGTVAVVATSLQRDWLGGELKPEYVSMAERRLAMVPVRLWVS